MRYVILPVLWMTSCLHIMAEHSRPGKGVNSKVRQLNGVSNGFDTAAYRQSSGQYKTEAESDIYDCFVWQEEFS